MTRRKSKNIPASLSPPRLVQNQKYSLQRKDSTGSFRRVATYNHEISQEEVLKEHGPGYFILRSTKPRLRTIWKSQLGNDDTEQLKDLQKKTERLTYGFYALGATEVVGLGLSAVGYWKLSKRVKRIEVVLRSLKPFGLSCRSCGKPIDGFLHNFCAQCGSPIKWPEDQLPIGSFTSTCVHCGFWLQEQQRFCPDCGQRRPIQVPFKFLPVKP
jgi:hypothetical protein